ncbi:hypothetical protein FRC07_007418 [Ceratobasidium sp. 392]|nr:hypothetical protein FRC07_007418 [Ceratobasidium sp. 392]
MSRPRSSLFLHLKSQPNPDANSVLWDHRLRQRRPISRNPFVPDEPSASYEITDLESPGPTRRPTLIEGVHSESGTKEASREDVNSESKNLDVVWGEQAPKWLNLFYDLAWTATFSSLTSNNKFKAPWFSSRSRGGYGRRKSFIASTFTRTTGIDVSTYILHSPGSTEWESNDINTITPELYSAERLTKLSFEAIAIVVALSRLLLLIQHIRVAIYAKFTSQSKSYPLRLLIVPIALAISTALFFVAFVTTRRHGEEPRGAKAKFILWATGILVEVVAHIVRFQLDINEGIRLRSHGSIVNRFCGITTIIIGEGINAIAGTIYAIEKAPGFGGPTGAGIVCCAIIVFFLVYLYFEGAAPMKSVRRRAAWAMVHLPWLLSAILLLEGVKNQLLLSSFMNSANYLLDQTDTVLGSDTFDMAQINATMRPLLLKGGMTWDDQYQKLNDLFEQNATASNATELDDATLNDILGVWYLRLRMTTTLNTYINFMDNDTIADDVQETIARYQNDYAFAYQDVVSEYADILDGFVWDLIKNIVTNARYISALCGLTFICLGTLNLIQSWPRDRFQWASIISRYAMGLAMMMLLLLNIGKYQSYWTPGDEPDSKRAGVFNWVDTTTLRGYRDQRRRPFLCNPFEPAQPLASGEVEVTNLPNLSHQPAKPSEGDSCEEKQDDPAKKATSFDNTQNENYDHGTGEPPEWLTLFYDLAWTASFSSITSNNKFKDLWDSVSYIAFFTVAWWIWMSQVFYSVDFYTDDWFNLGVIFSQFIIFGFLAAVMREVDVSTYIVHSPGSETLESYQVMTTTPEQYAADKIAKKSFELVAIVVAVSRALLLAQHIIVNIFAKRTYQSRRYPYRLLVIPFSLVISTGLFFAGYIITKKHGEEAKGATLKFILWGTGILVEAIAHIARFQWEINDGLRLKSRGSIVGRLTTITTIIVGEGINAIAGTLYFIEKAPDFSGTMAIGVICCAIIVFFLVYLYFESAAPLNQPVRRRAAWAMAHLPWLLSVILLLEGVKNQLLLSNFLNSGNYIVDQTYNALAAPFNDEQKFNATFEHIMLQAGMTWDDQFQKLNDLLQNQNITDADIAQLDPSVDEVVGVWYARLQTSNILNMYLNFMTNETISEDVQKLINRYQNDYAFTYQAWCF